MGPAKRGHLEVVRSLLNIGADIEKTNSVRKNMKERKNIERYQKV